MAEKRSVVVTALVNLVYDKEQVRIGGKFKIRKSDLEELTERCFIEDINQEDTNQEDINQEDTNEEDNSDGEDNDNEIEGD